jgi:SPX domain protein involved in polyphosphate accumulation
MAVKTTFKRIEKKYIISPSQYDILKSKVDEFFHPDEYGETKICNLYFDTPDFLLTRRSVEKPVYKEKLRLRTYGIPTNQSISFSEIKRKYESVVYKRRIALPLDEAMKFLCSGKDVEKPSQISREIKYFLSLYKDLEPRFYISYDRSAFFANDDENFRITFDKNLIWRDYDLDLTKGSYGSFLLPDGYILMELKVSDTIPLWLVRIFSESGIKSTSFSKVGKAYITKLSQRSLDYGILENNIFE